MEDAETTPPLSIRGQNNDRFIEATDVNKQREIEGLAQIQPNGGRDHLSAIENAMTRKPDAIFLITDSDEPNASEQQLEELIATFPATQVYVRRMVTEFSAVNSLQ